MWLASCAGPAISSTTLLLHENRTDVLLSCQSGYWFGRRHSCGSSCSCGPARCSLVFELVRTMVRSIGVTSYVQDVGRLTNKVARATSSGYVRGSRAASFSTVRLMARASSCPSQLIFNQCFLKKVLNFDCC